LNEAAVRRVREDDLRDAGHDQRVDHAGDRGHHQQHHQGGTKCAHGESFSDQPARGEQHIDRFDAGERRYDAAEAVDQEVAPQQRRRATGR
jgi:hypothetical protein